MALAAALFLVCPAMAVYSPPDVQTIIKNSVAANKRDWEAAPRYSYRECDRIGSTTKTYEVTMILGTPYSRLIAVNDQPLSPGENAKEERKLQQVIAERRAETPEQRQRRIAKWDKERRRDRLMMDQLTQAFEFKLLGSRIVDARETYVLRATPRKGYKPPNMETQVLPAMRGELWIDKRTFQWVKVTARVTRPISIEGFLAQVQPGTRFELEKMPVEDGIWLAKHFETKSSAKVLFLFDRTDEADNTFFDYRKITDPSAFAPTNHSK